MEIAGAFFWGGSFFGFCVFFPSDPGIWVDVCSRRWREAKNKMLFDPTKGRPKPTSPGGRLFCVLDKLKGPVEVPKSVVLQVPSMLSGRRSGVGRLGLGFGVGWL